jgi:DNA-binding response OmpR family regulator
MCEGDSGRVKLLLVEDSRRLQRALSVGLKRAGHAVHLAADGELALDALEREHFDLVILDLMLPRIDGRGVLQRMRERDDDTHVLILTARDRVLDRVEVLNAGADDFLAKPFAFDELLARVQALGRRQHGHKNPHLRVGPLDIDTCARRVLRDGEPLPLRHRELAVLEFLALRADRFVSRQELEDHLYDGRDDPSSNVVPAAIYALRQLIDRPGEPSMIETRRGLGYVLLSAPHSPR